MAFYDDIPEGYSEEEKKDGLHFYYNREERISRAPKIVRDFYDGKLGFKKGLFRALVSNKFNRFMLFTVALCFVVVIITSFFGSRPSLVTAAGYELELSAFSYDENVYAQIKIHPLKKSLEDKAFLEKVDSCINDGGEVMAVFSFIEADGEPFSKIPKGAPLEKKSFFLRTNCSDYDIIKVRAEVKILGERVELTADVKPSK